jgi:hypothetical protein
LETVSGCHVPTPFGSVLSTYPFTAAVGIRNPSTCAVPATTSFSRGVATPTPTFPFAIMTMRLWFVESRNPNA